MKKVAKLGSFIVYSVVSCSIFTNCLMDPFDNGKNSTEETTRFYQSFDENGNLILPIIYHDFRGYDEVGSGDGFITSNQVDQYGDYFIAGRGHPDFEKLNISEKEIVANSLDSDGYPIFNKSKGNITKNSFDMWYRDYPGINTTIKELITLNLIDSDNKIYRFASSAFFPLDKKGYGNFHGDHNFGFTDYISFYIKYTGNGSIEVKGDDDIWVFVNNKLAVDLGGCHSSLRESISLLGTDKTECINGTECEVKYNSDYDFYEGDLVEIKIFHAERHGEGSEFGLTLNGLDVFLKK